MTFLVWMISFFEYSSFGNMKSFKPIPDHAARKYRASKQATHYVENLDFDNNILPFSVLVFINISGL